jgi:hypothetical protein
MVMIYTLLSMMAKLKDTDKYNDCHVFYSKRFCK